MIILCADNFQPQTSLPPGQLSLQLCPLLLHLVSIKSSLPQTWRPTWPSLLTTVLWSFATSASLLSALPEKVFPVFLFCPIQYPPPNSWAELAASATSAAISSTWHQAHLSASKTLICIFDVLSHYFAFVTCVWHLVITLFLKAATASFPLSSFFSATSTSASPSFSPATASSSLQTL